MAERTKPTRRKPPRKRVKLCKAELELLVDSFRELAGQCERDSDLRPRLLRLLTGDVEFDAACGIFERYLRGEYDD